MNASIYVWRRAVFVADPKIFYADTKLFEMPEVRSQDIDSELDFEIVSLIMKERNDGAT
jgi:N-acylneuraminate cytidylyltransferase/CMP-N,N'-diacetyllegionaminic acid synthase